MPLPDDDPAPTSAHHRSLGFSHAQLRNAALRELDVVINRGPLRAVLAARLCRIALGAWLGLCAAAVMRALLMQSENDPPSTGVLGLAALALLAAPLAALAGWATGRIAGRSLLLASAAAALDREALSEDAGARFRTPEGLEALLGRVAAGEGRSIAWLLCGTALIAPLASHLAAFMLVRGQVSTFPFDGNFDRWFGISVMLTPHSPVILAVMGWRHGQRVAATPTGTEPRGSFGLAALGWTVLSLCTLTPISGFGWFTPTLVVTLAGLLFVPLVWRLTTLRALHERALLASYAR